MESSAAVEIWKRFVDKNKLVYSTYVGDNDSSSFKNLLNSHLYQGIETVRKEECLGHVQKRLKKHFKKKSNSNSKLAAGKVERVSQLYALVVCKNRGKSPSVFRKALWNLLEKHENCPFSTEFWCYLQKAFAENAEDTIVTLPPLRQPHMTESEYGRAKKAFESFASLNMCLSSNNGPDTKCQRVLTFNILAQLPNNNHVSQKSIEAIPHSLFAPSMMAN